MFKNVILTILVVIICGLLISWSYGRSNAIDLPQMEKQMEQIRQDVEALKDDQARMEDELRAINADLDKLHWVDEDISKRAGIKYD